MAPNGHGEAHSVTSHLEGWGGKSNHACKLHLNSRALKTARDQPYTIDKHNSQKRRFSNGVEKLGHRRSYLGHATDSGQRPDGGPEQRAAILQ